MIRSSLSEWRGGSHSSEQHAESLTRRLSLLVHPAFTGAVALLAVNDHLLKGVGPAWLTGKLSDFAGVFVITVLVAMFGSPRIAALATGVGFSVLKLSPAVAQWSAPLLGGLTRSDPTDLIALVAVVPAFALASRHCADTRGGFPVRPMLLVASGVAVVLSTTATSCSNNSPVRMLVVEGERIFTPPGASGPSSLSGTGVRWAVSDDGGVTWRETERRPRKNSIEALMPFSTRVRQRQSVCLSSGPCFEVEPGQAVLERKSPDSTSTTTSFAFSAEQRRRLNLRSTCGDPVGVFTSIAAVRVDGVEHVVVAMDEEGVLHRTKQGPWERRPVLAAVPDSLSGPSWFYHLRVAPLFLLFLGGPVILWLLSARGERGVGGPYALLGFGTVVTLFLSGLLSYAPGGYAVLGPLIAGLALSAFVGSIALALWGRAR